MPRWILAAAGGGLVVVAAAGALVWLGRTAEPTATDPNSARLVARGKLVYTEQCASCHGANLEGQPNWQHPLPNRQLPAPPHDASGHTWHHSDNQLFDMVKNGTVATLPPGYPTGMPAYKEKLSDTEIWAVLSYIESTWPADIRAKQQRMKGGRP